MSDAPSNEDLFNEDGFKVIKSTDDAKWRHGAITTTVYQRESDGTYWQAIYRVSTDGETNELSDGGARITQVVPFERTVTDYRAVASVGAIKAIDPWRRKHRNTNHREVVECPVCKGRLHLSIAAVNNHVQAACETKDCISWME